LEADTHPAGSDVPRFEFFLETADQPLTREHPVWSLPLPSNRRWQAQTASIDAVGATSVGEYLCAVRQFLEGPARLALYRDLARGGADSSGPERFRIYLAKHGEFYHPARIEAALNGGKRLQWVVNVALSAAGGRLIRKEYALLEKLFRQGRPAYIPEVYAFAEMPLAGGRSLPMFLGEWFSGYHEFHLTRSTPTGEQQLVLWDPENGSCVLARKHAEDLYRRAARILAHYFNPVTFECIGAWHHAAGDFVARRGGSGMDVRLVSVREYRPFLRLSPATSDADSDIRTRLEVLLLFLLQVSIRMRLDRLDGVGQIGWSGQEAVDGTVAGVVEAVADKPAPPGLSLAVLFRRYLAASTEEELLDLCRGIAAKTIRLDSPDYSLVKSRLPEHAADLVKAIRRL
jgi:hypothetical protein